MRSKGYGQDLKLAKRSDTRQLDGEKVEQSTEVDEPEKLKKTGKSGKRAATTPEQENEEKKKKAGV